MAATLTTYTGGGVAGDLDDASNWDNGIPNTAEFEAVIDSTAHNIFTTSALTMGKLRCEDGWTGTSFTLNNTFNIDDSGSQDGSLKFEGNVTNTNEGNSQLLDTNSRTFTVDGLATFSSASASGEQYAVKFSGTSGTKTFRGGLKTASSTDGRLFWTQTSTGLSGSGDVDLRRTTVTVGGTATISITGVLYPSAGDDFDDVTKVGTTVVGGTNVFSFTGDYVTFVDGILNLDTNSVASKCGGSITESFSSAGKGIIFPSDLTKELEMVGSGATSIDTALSALALGSLKINTSGGTVQFANAQDINGKVTLADGTLDGNSNDHTVAGGWDQSGGGSFTADTNTITFDAASGTHLINGADFHKIDIDASGSVHKMNGAIGCNIFILNDCELDPDGNTLTSSESFNGNHSGL